MAFEAASDEFARGENAVRESTYPESEDAGTRLFVRCGAFAASDRTRLIPDYSPDGFFDGRICVKDGDFFLDVERGEFLRTSPPFPHRVR